jgi:Spy/CpxP family protein refolding chaperone
VKSTKLFTACLFTLSIGVSCLAAVTQSAPPTVNQGAPSVSVSDPRGGWPTPQETVTRMSSKLNLTDEQKAKITPVITDRQAQMRALMADTSGRKFQKARKAKGIMSDSDKKIEAVLTKDQQKTYEEMKAERREQMQAQMRERGNGTAQQ